jgi:hypothetical protein
MSVGQSDLSHDSMAIHTVVCFAHRAKYARMIYEYTRHHNSAAKHAFLFLLDTSALDASSRHTHTSQLKSIITLWLIDLIVNPTITTIIASAKRVQG